MEGCVLYNIYKSGDSEMPFLLNLSPDQCSLAIAMTQECPPQKIKIQHPRYKTLSIVTC